jgi:hypothetical protein
VEKRNTNWSAALIPSRLDIQQLVGVQHLLIDIQRIEHVGEGFEAERSRKHK